MRQIKFRGKRVDNGEWIYGFLATPIKINCIAEPNPLEVFGLTIGQFTGLKDKNGQDIYEGDIIADSEMNYTVKYGKYDDNLIDDTAFGWYTENDGYYSKPIQFVLYANTDQLEVIGNIHDNPELL